MNRNCARKLVLGCAVVWCATAWERAAAESGNLVPAEIRSAIDAGRFEDAHRLIDRYAASARSEVQEALADQAEIMRRIRIDYSLDRDAILAKLNQSIPDVTARDVDAWTEQGVLQHRKIEGNTYYFRREPSNLLRFCPEAKSRVKAGGRDGDSDDGGFSLVDHVAELVAESARHDGPIISPVRHRVRYTLTVPADHPRVKNGSTVRCWLPFPQEYRQQRDVKLARQSPDFKKLAPNGSPHRTAYFERTIESDGQKLEFWVEMEFVTAAYVPNLSDAAANALDSDSDEVRREMQSRPPHIPLDDKTRTLAESIVGDETNPLARARRIFHWVVQNIDYCSEMEYSTIPSLTRKALASRKGDCGVQAMTFITLCRAAGIPARWQSGWESLPGRENMHDWAEFYVAPWGWLPADPSYGLLDHPDPSVREFYFGHLDPYRMIVNLDFAQPLDPPKQSFRSEPNDFQRGEIEIDGVNLYFDEWVWDFDVTTEGISQAADSASNDRNADQAGMHKRIRQTARTIWPECKLPVERASWFCDLFLRLAIKNSSLVYVDAHVQSDGERVVIEGATNVQGLGNLLPNALAAVGVEDVECRIGVLPDREKLEGKLFGVCVASSALTWQIPYVPGAADCDAEKPGEQTELLFGEPVYLLDRRDGCYLLHGSDGYWGWVKEDDIAPMGAIEFNRYQRSNSRAVMTRDVTTEGLTVPRGAIVALSMAMPEFVEIVHPDGHRISAPHDAVRLIESDSLAGDGIISAARTFLKVPYVFGGRSPEGTDCSGLITNVFGQYQADVARDAWQQAFEGDLVGTTWHRDNIQAGDQVFFIDLSGKIYHTGIAMDKNTILHAAPPAVRISSLVPDDPNYEHRLNRDFFMAKRRSTISNRPAETSEPGHKNKSGQWSPASAGD